MLHYIFYRPHCITLQGNLFWLFNQLTYGIINYREYFVIYYTGHSLYHYRGICYGCLASLTYDVINYIKTGILDYMLLYHIAIVTVCKQRLCSIITTSILQQVSVFHIILYILVKFM